MFEQQKKSVLKKVNSYRAALLFTFMIFAAQAFAQTAPTTETLKNSITSPERLSASFAEVAKIVEPAVVNIDTKGKVPEVTARGEVPSDSDDILDFLRQMPRRPTSAVGSGFIVNKSGYILTNAHVVEDSSRITVRLDSGEEYTAKIIGVDQETDVAVLKIEAGRDLPFVKLGDSEKARVGDWVLAIGSPFGLARTVTAGIVSQTKRESPISQFQKFIQTDAAINRGNSGGPLVNMDGEVIGINSQIATSTGDYNGIGFALPANEASYVYRQILQNGKVRRGFLGVNLDSVRTEYAKVYGLPQASGAIVTEVRDTQSPAAKAGLKVGDVITDFNGQKVQSAQDLIAKIASTKPEESVNLVFMRETDASMERKTTSIKLGERPPSRNQTANADDTRRKLPLDGVKEELKPFGLTLIEMTPALAATYKLDGQKGLVVKEINPASFIADVKMSNGSDALDENDVIQRVNRIAVPDLKTFNDVTKNLKTGAAVVMHVMSTSRSGRAPQLKIVQFTVQ